jgi:hypothetical protein
MSYSTGRQDPDNQSVNFILSLIGIVFAIINFIIGLIGIYHLIIRIIYKDYKISDFTFLMFVEGIVLIISLYIMQNKLNYKTLLFIPIVTGIISIIVGITYVNDRIYDIESVALYSKLIIGGMLLIIASFIIIKNINYKKMIFIPIIFLFINVIIESLNFYEQIKYNYLFGARISCSQIIAQILGLIVFFIIIKKRENYEFMICISIIFGATSVLIGSAQMYIKIFRPAYSYSENNGVITLGTMIFGGILLIILLFKIINKVNYKIILFIPIPFGITNIIYGIYILFTDVISFGSFYWSLFFIAIISILEGLILFIIPCRSIVKFNNQEQIE